MKYLDKTFSAPAGPARISQREWDYATLTSAEFFAKYGSDDRVESPLRCGCSHSEDQHFPVMDSDGYPHEWEQFCLGGENCPCNHFEWPVIQH